MHHQMLQWNRRRAMVASGLTALAAAAPGVARASHHFEAAAVRRNPKLGLTDLYVFGAPAGDRTVFILNANFLPKPDEDLLDRAALYNIHCATDGHFKAGFTWTLAYDGTSVALMQLDEANGALGAKGAVVGRFEFGKSVRHKTGLRTWVGQAKDPFFGNSPGLTGFRAQLAQGRYDPQVWARSAGKNIFVGRKCCSIVMEVPNSMLGRSVQVYSTVAVERSEGWRQVQYMANPLVAHTMLFEDEALKASYDASRPDKQQEFASFFSARVARAAHFAKSRPDPFGYGDDVARLLLPDVIRYEVGTAAAYLPERLNGRKMGDDGMSTMLTLLIGEPTDQKLKNPKLHTADFPYVVPA